jgi:hypothetical protein
MRPTAGKKLDVFVGPYYVMNSTAPKMYVRRISDGIELRCFGLLVQVSVVTPRQAQRR